MVINLNNLKNLKVKKKKKSCTLQVQINQFVSIQLYTLYTKFTCFSPPRLGRFAHIF